MNFDCDKFKPYNKLIAETFYKAGLIESWGRGTQRIVEECEKASLPIPKFEYKDGTFYVTFFKRNSEKENVTENVTENREDLIIKLIMELEKWYFHNRSLYVDFMIIFLTVWVIIFPKSDLVYKIFPTLPKKDLDNPIEKFGNQH